MSSAKRECVASILEFGNEIPYHNPHWLRVVIVLLRVSSMMINKNGYSGYPCLTPWDALNLLHDNLLMRAKKLAPFNNERTHLHNFLENT